MELEIIVTFFFQRFNFFFRERERVGKREGEKHQCVVASHAPPTGDLPHNPGMCPDWESKRWLFVSKASVQSTETHQPGLRDASYTLWIQRSLNIRLREDVNEFPTSREENWTISEQLHHEMKSKLSWEFLLSSISVSWFNPSLLL